MKHTHLTTVKKYLILTFLITWLSWWILALLTHITTLSNQSLFGRALFLIGGFGPTIAALFVLPADANNANKRNIKTFLLRHTPGSRKILLLYCLLTFLLFFLPARRLDPAVPLFMFPVIWIMMTFFTGGNEELGWRGTMQPLLEKAFGFVPATLLTGTTWALWHIPLWFIQGDSHAAVPYLSFFVLGLLLSVFLAGLYKATKSVLCAMIYHGFLNTVMTFVPIQVNAVFFVALALMCAFAVIVWYRADKKEKSSHAH
ncbi:MAG: CPBP family intramembrane metalloprotease [Eubacteriaceae bacterium]|jgi:membrane protease YdiL (CAAX protease family)|nr:CPBP family intramembrane metalloprotease [Eubacteriaceae bacterium]